MNSSLDVGDTFTKTMDKFGREFLFGYYLPAFSFVIVQILVVWPLSIGKSIQFNLIAGMQNQSPNPNDNWMIIAEIILLPVLVGLILVTLNNPIIRLFEGEFWWLKYGLLYPLKRFNNARSKKLYDNLKKLRNAYTGVSQKLTSNDRDPSSKTEILQQLDSLAHQMDQEHECIEKRELINSLPADIQRVAPTKFGNTYALIEEYPFDHYGIDSVLFWPRFRDLLRTNQPDLSRRITNQKTMLDMSLNFCLLSSLAVVEGFLILKLRPSQSEGTLLLLILFLFVLFLSFYNAAIHELTTLGEFIKICFDFHRTLILKAFEIEQPDNLIEERIIWIRLAAFIRRGEEFYFPKTTHQLTNKGFQ